MNQGNFELKKLEIQSKTNLNNEQVSKEVSKFLKERSKRTSENLLNMIDETSSNISESYYEQLEIFKKHLK